MIFKKLAPRIVFPSVCLLFVGLGACLHHLYGDFYQNATDPEYTLLYNGIIVSTGSFAINFIHHPATPTIFIAGLSSLLIRPFAEHSPFVLDFIKRPETYLAAANFLQLLLIGLSAFWAAKKGRQLSKNSFIGILLLLGLFSHYHLLEITARFLPEASLLIPILLSLTLMLRFLYLGENEEQIKKLRWQFPMVVAFGIGCKLSFAPFLLLPILLFVNSWRHFWLIFRNTALFSLLFAYPLFTNYSESFGWIGEMISHSGLHGSGESTFINWSQIPQHVNLLWHDFPAFWVLVLLNSGLVIYLYASRGLSPFEKRLRKVLLAVLLCLSLLIFLVLKHFALHYFMPFYLLSGAWLLFPYLYFSGKANISKKVVQAIVLVAALGLIVNTVYEGKKALQLHRQVAIQRAEKAEMLTKLISEEKAALIVDAPSWGTPFPEYAHAFGFMHTYRRKTYFKDQLREEYPNFYLHVGWTEKFNHWDQFVDFSFIFSKSKVVYLYSGRTTKGMVSILERLEKYRRSGKQIQEQVLWEGQENSQLIRLEQIN